MPACTIPLADQFADLRGQLDLGEYGTVMIDPALLTWAKDALSCAVSEHAMPVPYMYPTPDGHAQAEWTFHRIEASATFTPDGLLLFSCNVGHAGTYESRELPKDCDAAAEVAKFVAESQATGIAGFEARRRDFLMFGRAVR
ncbi:MAG TPA: hypothetical protein VFB99_01500 [Vicinamibacterales bacterium]|nr:hypothetical protein [Vicinamibacterales bacterium]